MGSGDGDSKNNRTQRDIGKLEGKVEMMISAQANYEQKREGDVKHIFNKMDDVGKEMRGAISEGNARIHKRLDDHITEMKKTNGEQDKAINKIALKQATSFKTSITLGGSSGGVITGIILAIKHFLSGG